MKAGEGAGLLIADGWNLSRAEIRRKWLAGDYGPEGERPRKEWVDFTLKQLGK